MKNLLTKALHKIAKDHRNQVIEEMAQLWLHCSVADRNNFARTIRAQKES